MNFVQVCEWTSERVRKHQGICGFGSNIVQTQHTHSLSNEKLSPHFLAYISRASFSQVLRMTIAILRKIEIEQ